MQRAANNSTTKPFAAGETNLLSNSFNVAANNSQYPQSALTTHYPMTSPSVNLTNYHFLRSSNPANNSTIASNIKRNNNFMQVSSSGSVGDTVNDDYHSYTTMLGGAGHTKFVAEPTGYKATATGNYNSYEPRASTAGASLPLKQQTNMNISPVSGLDTGGKFYHHHSPPSSKQPTGYSDYSYSNGGSSNYTSSYLQELKAQYLNHQNPYDQERDRENQQQPVPSPQASNNAYYSRSKSVSVLALHVV